MKLITLRQYQRRILKYSKKSLVKPPKEPKPGFLLPKSNETKEKETRHLCRILEGATDPDNIVDEKLLKNLLPKA